MESEGDYNYPVEHREVSSDCLDMMYDFEL